MPDDNAHGIAAGPLRQFIKHFEQLESERHDMAGCRKALMAEAQTRGLL